MMKNCTWCLGRGHTFSGPHKSLCMACGGSGKVEGQKGVVGREIYSTYITECDDYIAEEFAKDLPDRQLIILLAKAIGMAREKLGRL